MTEFLNMGGYGLWVWAAYGVVAVGLLGLAVDTKLRAKAAKKAVEDLRPKRNKKASGK